VRLGVDFTLEDLGSARNGKRGDWPRNASLRGRPPAGFRFRRREDAVGFVCASVRAWSTVSLLSFSPCATISTPASGFVSISAIRFSARAGSAVSSPAASPSGDCFCRASIARMSTEMNFAQTSMKMEKMTLHQQVRLMLITGSQHVFACAHDRARFGITRPSPIALRLRPWPWTAASLEPQESRVGIREQHREPSPMMNEASIRPNSRETPSPAVLESFPLARCAFESANT